MMRGGTVNSLGMVIYEADSGVMDDVNPVDNVGLVTDYSDGVYAGPGGNAVFYHERDSMTYEGMMPGTYVTTSDVMNPNGQHNPGGETGLVNRFPFTENGIQPIEDFNLRGAAPVVPKRSTYGAYGAVGQSDIGDYSTYYAQAIAQGAQDQVTQEQSWAAISGGY